MSSRPTPAADGPGCSCREACSPAQTMSAPLPLACDPTAIDPAQRAAHGALAEHLLADGAQEIQELPDGFAARFTAEQYPLVSAFVDNERRCCPFLTFRLEVQAGQGPVWLRITGPEGVKELFVTEVAARAGGRILLPVTQE